MVRKTQKAASSYELCDGKTGRPLQIEVCNPVLSLKFSQNTLFRLAISFPCLWFSPFYLLLGLRRLNADAFDLSYKILRS